MIAASLVLVALGAGTAAAAESGNTDVVRMVEVKGQLKFEAPKTVAKGDQLEVVNETDPRKVGPHTFSLVTKGSEPRTHPARKNCFTPKHICLAIAKWHGFDPKTERISVNPAKAGPKGWSTMGNATGKKGDSWFTGKKGQSISQEVTASPSTTLYFVCAVHPWMQGKVKVVAPTG